MTHYFLQKKFIIFSYINILFIFTAFADIELYNNDGKILDLKLELQAATFDNSNSWFGESTSFTGSNTDNWAETTGEIGLEFQAKLDKGSLFTQVSGLQSKTYSDDASGLGYGEQDPNLFHIEQAHLGWRSGDTFTQLGKDAVTIQAGKFDYQIGSGLLIADGGGDGGSRGGWWIGARKTFSDAFLIQLKTNSWLVEGFTIKNNARPKSYEGQAYGVNSEYNNIIFNSLFGVTWFRVEDTGNSYFKKFDVASFRINWAPNQTLHFNGEYVDQNNSALDAQGWYLCASYHFLQSPWNPTLSYRYAHFDGDDPDTNTDEGFRTVAYGFTDYGTWYQGEIAGNYPIENSNIQSDMVRLELSPKHNLTINLLYYHFTLDENHILGTPVANNDFGDEINLSIDWAINKQTLVVTTVGSLFPGDAAKDWVGNNKNWNYTMLYISYSF